MDKSKILVTGSSGHVGAELVKVLRHSGHSVSGLDTINGPFTNLIGSITEDRLVDEATNKVEVIIHTASLHAPHVPNHSKKEFVNVNVHGTLNLLEAAKRNGTKKFIYTSTTSLYGEQFENEKKATWITENLPPKPRDIYDITKIAAEQLCKDFFDEKSLQTTSLRASRFWNEPLADKVFYRMYRGVDVQDVVKAHQLAMDHHFSQFEIFNISAEPLFEKGDLVALRTDLKGVLQDRIPEIIQCYEQKGWALPHFIDRVYVIEKAKEILGYQPQFNIRELMAEIGC